MSNILAKLDVATRRGRCPCRPTSPPTRSDRGRSCICHRSRRTRPGSASDPVWPAQRCSRRVARHAVGALGADMPTSRRTAAIRCRSLPRRERSRRMATRLRSLAPVPTWRGHLPRSNVQVCVSAPVERSCIDERCQRPAASDRRLEPRAEPALKVPAHARRRGAGTARLCPDVTSGRVLPARADARLTTRMPCGPEQPGIGVARLVGRPPVQLARWRRRPGGNQGARIRSLNSAGLRGEVVAHRFADPLRFAHDRAVVRARPRGGRVPNAVQRAELARAPPRRRRRPAGKHPHVRR